MNVDVGGVGGIRADNRIGCSILSRTGADRIERALQIGGRIQGIVAELVRYLPRAHRRALSGDLRSGVLGGYRGYRRRCEQRDGAFHIHLGTPAGNLGARLVYAHNDIDLLVGKRRIDIGAHIDDLELETEVVGKGGGYVHVEADDLARRLPGERGVVLGGDSHAEHSRFDNGIGRNGRALLFRCVVLGRATRQRESRAEGEHAPEHERS